MGGGQKGKKPGDTPVQKGGISKKKPDAAKAADGAPKRKPKPKGKGDRADDDALIASLISCAAGNDKAVKKGDRDNVMDMELVAALAAEACLPATGSPIPTASLQATLAKDKKVNKAATGEHDSPAQALATGFPLSVPGKEPRQGSMRAASIMQQPSGAHPEGMEGGARKHTRQR